MEVRRKFSAIGLKSFVLFSTIYLLSGCDEYAAGNFSSEVNKIVWTSNQNDQRLPSATTIETFNIFIMDGDGSNRTQLTNDAWPIINQHPVFTPESDRIVWLRGDSLWHMRLDGSDKQRLTSPPNDEADGHPWAGADGYVYFTRVEVRNAAPFASHRIWRIRLDGSGEQEIIGSADIDRFHPNLHPDENQLLYTAGPPGSGMGTEIRVYNLTTNEDKVILGPGALSAAIFHPGGEKLVLAQNPDGNTNYEIAEYEYPSGKFLRTIIGDRQNNTIPYYDYPAGARILWTAQPDIATQWRRNRHLWLKASDPKQITIGPFENTHIVGEIVIDPQNNRCIPRPVGCYPTPPPCQKLLLPGAISDDAIELSQATAIAHLSQNIKESVTPEGYAEFMRADIAMYRKGEVDHVTPDLEKRAINLFSYLEKANDEAMIERVADIYVNSYLDLVSREGEVL